MSVCALAYGTALAYLGRLPIWLPDVPLHDKALHFFGYGLVAATLDAALGRRDCGHRPRVPLAAAAILALSALDEVAQSFSATRSVSPFDFLANLLGVVLFVRLGRAVTRASSPRRPA